jgi:hypothetical protein
MSDPNENDMIAEIGGITIEFNSLTPLVNWRREVTICVPPRLEAAFEALATSLGITYDDVVNLVIEWGLDDKQFRKRPGKKIIRERLADFIEEIKKPEQRVISMAMNPDLRRYRRLKRYIAEAAELLERYHILLCPEGPCYDLDLDEVEELIKYTSNIDVSIDEIRTGKRKV